MNLEVFILATVAAWIIFAIAIVLSTLFDWWKMKIMQRLIIWSLGIASVGTLISSLLTN